MITDFKRAESVDEAVALQKEGYHFLAGGTQLNNAGYRKYGAAVGKVVSLDALALGGIEKKDGGWIIGAGVTLQELADSGAVPGALKSAAGFIPTRSVRNIATIGGNVGAKRPDSYIIPALIALGATAETVDGMVAVEEYVSSENGSLILRFRIPAFEGVCKAVKESRSHLALPVVSAAVRIAAGKESIGEAVVAAGCVARRTLRLESVEAGLLTGELLSGELLEAAIASAVEPKSDFLGSTAFKKYENSVVIAECIRACLKEARR
jgi:putative selenate reductase FAD-binding subunit